MNPTQTRDKILELCSESEHGSWEFWSDADHKTDAERGLIVDAIAGLVKDQRIVPLEYESISDQTYQEVPLDLSRLDTELRTSMTPGSVDPHSFYWFIAK
jgi:hypothetical protein